jgi:CBS domain-containing protein
VLGLLPVSHEDLHALIQLVDAIAMAIRSIDIDAILKEAGGLLGQWQVRFLLLGNGARYIGIVTDTDLSCKAVAKGLDGDRRWSTPV